MKRSSMNTDFLNRNNTNGNGTNRNNSNRNNADTDSPNGNCINGYSITFTLQKAVCLILSLVLAVCILPIRAAANFEIPRTCLVRADGGAAYTVKTLDYDYDYNTYFSLRDMAMVLGETDKAFSLDITKSAVSLKTGQAYAPVGEENTPWEDNRNPGVSLGRNEFQVNGRKVFYYTMIMKMPSGCYDCFMMAADLAMILDMDISVPAAGSLQIHTDRPFRISPAGLEEEGYFDRVDTLLVGDASTGEIYYEYQADIPHPIASITKLMTYFLTMDSVYGGQITLDQQVAVSEAAHLLSSSDDGVIRLEAGQEVTVQELLIGSLLPSSNECALCLAETIAGSEENFVRMMNRKAAELGLSDSVFFNSHGLPSYTEATLPPDRQNRMSAEELFQMVSGLLKVYPQVKEITSLRSAVLPSLELEVYNINPLLRNLPEVTGLKTGSTNKAGSCLVTSLTADDGDRKHDLVVIVLGAENSIERGRISELLARYALDIFYTGVEEKQGTASDRNPENLPLHAEVAVECILQTAGIGQVQELP